MILDPVSGLAKFALGLIEHKTLQAWARLIFGMVFSGIVSFLIACGGALVAGRSAAVSVGTGMLMSGVLMTVLFRTSPLTKGIKVALPEQEAELEIKTDAQTIERK